MSQPYIDWDLLEHRNFQTYQYCIFRITDADKRTTLKGWAIAPNGLIWLEDEVLDNLRLACIQHGRQLS